MIFEGPDLSTLADPSGEELVDDGRRWALTIAAHPDPAHLDTRIHVDGLVRLGRAGAFDHPRVSRDHAHVEPDETGALHVVDRGGKNGTTINGVRASGAVLASGDVIGMGPILVLVHRVPRNAIANAARWLDGTSAVIAELDRRIELVARRGESLLVTGETGTGKTRLAEKLAGTVIELDRATPERIEELERVLDRGERVIATARAAIPEALRSRFPWTVELPPLRDRVEDIPVLVRDRLPLHHAFVLRLLRDPWPGNIRELFAAVERNVVERDESEPPAPAPNPALVIARDGSWFAPPNGSRVSLGKRGNLARIVAMLATSETLSLDDILAAGWPNERVLESAGVNRVHVALTTLRKLGLRDHLERIGDRYRLSVTVSLVEP